MGPTLSSLFLCWQNPQNSLGRGGESKNQYSVGAGTERPCGLMDKASVSDTGDCKFESCQGRQGFGSNSRERIC